MLPPIRVVAFGGGHGLAASLRALRHSAAEVDLRITAVVTVGDDGGSSGRLRAQRGGLPPGDLRQAIAALAADDPLSTRTAELLQYRWADRSPQGGPDDPLGGHAVGNLLLSGLFEMTDDPVAALDHVGALVRAQGRVLPMSCEPVGIEADVIGADPDRPAELITVRGQRAVAITPGRVLAVRITPASPAACPETLTAVREADWLIFGPGSWYTSVIPHLLVPQLAEAILASEASRLVTLNLAPERETLGLSLAGHLAALRRYLPGLTVDTVIADGKAVGNPEPVRRAAESLGARLVLAPVAVADGDPRHDPVALGAALVPALGAVR
ncbi:MAG TPA: uridine diphosphate-N-acetylglucosamine-binding protein YvcK [Pilimelia sp.]|nr:uridine diphosphate-N-acetylglucosamine-binding protein YvcK [Pilimelia sp.]